MGMVPFKSRVQTSFAWLANSRTVRGCRQCVFESGEGGSEGVEIGWDISASARFRRDDPAAPCLRMAALILRDRVTMFLSSLGIRPVRRRIATRARA